MSPVNTQLLEEIYYTSFKALGQGRDAAITAALNLCLIPDPGVLAWLIGKLIDACGADMGVLALSIAVVCEYAKRTGSLKKGVCLSNHCSLCHLKGHNKTNHTPQIDNFLTTIGFVGKIDDINSFVDSVAA
jgi:hypothetical protein